MSEESKKFSDSDVEILSRTLEHDGFLKVEHISLRHRLFSGEWSGAFVRELQLRNPAVGVLLFDPEKDTLLFVRQFRVGMYGEDANSWPLEIVAGMVDHGEELAEVARRESKEESNCEPSELIKICEYYNSPGATNEKISLFCGRFDSTGAGGVYGLDSEHEDIEVQLISYDTAIEMLESGEINNAMTLVALQWLQLHRQEVLERWN